MGRHLTRKHAVLTARQQAAYFHARERRLSKQDPESGLFLTHTFTDTDFNVAAAFPSALVPLTFGIDVQLTATSIGTVFEIGGGTWGTALGLDALAGDLAFCSGGPRSQPDGVSATHSFVFPNSRRVRFVAAVHPLRRIANLWMDGRLVAAAISGGDTFQTHDGDTGGLGFISSDATNRLSNFKVGDLTDATIVGKLRVYYNQNPRGMFADGLGTDNGDGVWIN